MFTELDQLKEYCLAGLICLLQQARPELSSVPIKQASSVEIYVEKGGRVRERWMGMLTPHKFMKKRKKVEVFKDAANEDNQKNWRKLMNEIEEACTTVEALRTERVKNQAFPWELVLGTLKRVKQLKRWNLVSEIIEWLRIQSWWNISETDLLMLIIAYGKQGDFNSAERVMSYMNKKSYPPGVISHTALMEAYGMGKRYKNAEAISRRMQSSGSEPSALTYQIIPKTFIVSNQFKEAEVVFETLLDNEKSPLKPDQRMFHMMIYMLKKAGSYEKARRVFSLMVEREVEQSTLTYSSLISFETNYKVVSNIYDQMQRGGLRPDVVSYASLVNDYGKARREDEALAVFEEMLSAVVGPTKKTNNILLDAFAKSGMVEQARTVFKSMRRDRFTLDLCSYTTILSTYVNASDMDGAKNFFGRMKQDGLSPNEVTYEAWIKGYAKANDLEKMVEKYEEMRNSGIRANQMVLTTIMDSYWKNKDLDSVVIWFKERESSGVSPDKKPITYSSLWPNQTNNSRKLTYCPETRIGKVVFPSLMHCWCSLITNPRTKTMMMITMMMMLMTATVMKTENQGNPATKDDEARQQGSYEGSNSMERLRPGDATWEFPDDIMQKRSMYTLEDKCGFEGGNLMHGRRKQRKGDLEYSRNEVRAQHKAT